MQTDSKTLRTAQTVCPLDCADTCSLAVDIVDEKIVKVRGSKANPFTNGKICSKVATGMAEWVHGEKRLTSPLKRLNVDGKITFEPISWNTAYSEIKQNFDRIIANLARKRLLPLKYAGPMGVLSLALWTLVFLTDSARHNSIVFLSALAFQAAAWKSVLGDVGGIAHAEMASSKLIVIWANNITVGHLHLIKIIRQARKQGAKVVVIDPKRIRIADDADLFLQINPGTDLILAYAVANLIAQSGGLDKDFIAENVSGADQFLEYAQEFTVEFAAEKCGLSVAQIEQFAEYWCTLKPASLSMGVALERSRSGGSAIRGAMSLPLLTGNFLEEGAGICDPSSYFKIDRDCLKRPDWIAPGTRTLNILDIASHILNDDLEVPIKALFIYNHNPIAVHPRQALLKQALETEDLFIVGYDLNMTDSMQYADIILPACSSMEYGDLYKAYGHTALQRTEAVIAPIAEARANTRVFRELAEVFGFDDAEFLETDEQMLARAVDHLPAAGELIDSALESKNGSSFQTNIAFRDTLPNSPINKALLYNASEQERAGLGLPKFKELQREHEFILVSPSSDKRINSTLGGTTANAETYRVEMNALDAQRKGLNEGQKVVLKNQFAEVIIELSLSDKVKPGLVYVPKGAWSSNSESNLSINALIPSHKADMADGACYNDTQVDVLAI